MSKTLDKIDSFMSEAISKMGKKDARMIQNFTSVINSSINKYHKVVEKYLTADERGSVEVIDDLNKIQLDIFDIEKDMINIIIKAGKENE